MGEKDKAIVLEGLKDKLRQDVSVFMGMIESGEFELVGEIDEHGVLVENGDNLRFIPLPDLTELQPSSQVNDIAEILFAFKNSFVNSEWKEL